MDPAFNSSTARSSEHGASADSHVLVWLPVGAT
jgi:hypothetical protein